MCCRCSAGLDGRDCGECRRSAWFYSLFLSLALLRSFRATAGSPSVARRAKDGGGEDSQTERTKIGTIVSKTILGTRRSDTALSSDRPVSPNLGVRKPQPLHTTHLFMEYMSERRSWFPLQSSLDPIL